MQKVRDGYRRVKRIRPGVWQYRCLRCGKDVPSTSTGIHELTYHKDEQATGAQS